MQRLPRAMASAGKSRYVVRRMNATASAVARTASLISFLDYIRRAMPRHLTRRSLITGATIGSLTVFARSIRAADFNFTQYHNQAADSPLHRRLVEMWTAIG